MGSTKKRNFQNNLIIKRRTSFFLIEEINLRNVKLIAIVKILSKKRLMNHNHIITMHSKILNEKNKGFISSQNLE